MVTYILCLPISSKNFNSLDLDEFLSNADVLPCEYANYNIIS